MQCLLQYGAIFAVALLLIDAGTAVLPCPHACSEGTGSCIADHGVLRCECIGNWSGDDCSINICDSGDPCMNGGICSINPQDQSMYLCSCPTGFTGPHCEYFADGPLCNTNNTCGPNGTCYERASNGVSQGTTCVCDKGYWGARCLRPGPDPCAIDAVNYCWGHGTCVYQEMSPTGFTCVCDEGYAPFLWCRHTDLPAFCALDPIPCENGGTCVSRIASGISSYECICPPAYQGQNCTLAFDPCDSNPCLNGGTCQSTENGHYHSCVCPPNYSGDSCEGVVDPCEGTDCLNGGRCVTDVEADSNGLYDPSALNAATCDCDCGFTGGSCESVIDPCDSTPCLNGGTCTQSDLLTSNYTCNCAVGFTGPNCGTTDYCTPSPCEGANAFSCVNLPSGFFCQCREGWGGQTCLAVLDGCGANPCQNGGTCSNVAGGFECACLPEYTGVDCSTYVPMTVACNTSTSCKNGGTCVPAAGGGMADSCECPLGFNGSRCEMEVCPLDHCAAVADNGQCDLECFTSACGYDGNRRECFPPSNNGSPWENCTIAEECQLLFDNGICDVQCNRAECLYDANECIPPSPKCPTDLQRVCQGGVGDGNCDMKCNTEQCPFDSEDCDSKRFARDLLEIIIIADVGMPFEGSLRELFLEELGRLINSIPVVQEVRKLSRDDQEARNLPENTFGGNVIVYLITLRLDIEFCRDQCPQDAQDAVNMLHARFSGGRATVGPYRVADAYSSSSPDEEKGGGFAAYYVVVPILVVLAVPVVGWCILTGVKRKRVRAKLWRPQSPTSESDQSQGSSPPTERKQGHKAGTLVSSEATSISHSGSDDYIARGSKAAKMNGNSTAVRWSNIRVPVSDDATSTDEPSTAVIGQVAHDSRKWNCLHYDALRNPKLVQELVEKYRRHNGKSVDINTPGPGGYTPLMLAVTQRHSTSSYESFGLPCRSSSESSADVGELSALITTNAKSGKRVANGVNGSTDLTTSCDSTSFAIPTQNGVTTRIVPLESSVSALIASNVSLNTGNDFGQTALHLAAACSRGDYVKQLLDGGADPNLPDNWGQSPIHAAIGASAEGAFLILLNHAQLDINHKCDGGITPLMAAVKQCNPFMVKQLVKKNAEITATDNEGRTAVHWAAVINNLEALKLLIRQGPDTIKDQQDSKGQTPLFLACREGCASCVKHLLDCFANGTLLDSLDRSPMQIAYEKQHHDIIEMLKTSAHGPIYYPSHFHRSHVLNAAMYPMSSRPEQAQQVAPRGYAYPAARSRHTSKPSRERTIPEFSMQNSSATQLSSSGMQLPVASMRPYQQDYTGGAILGPSAGQTFGDLTGPVASTSVYADALQPTLSISQPHMSVPAMPTPTPTSYTTDMSGNVLQQELKFDISSAYPTTMGYSSAMAPTSLQQGIPTYDTTSSLPHSTMQLTSTATGCSDFDSVINSLSSIQPHPSSCVASTVAQTLPSHSIPSTSTYGDAAVSLSDIEPSVVNELITSMSEDPTTLPQPSTFNSHAPSVAITSQNGTYVSPSINDLPLVGYTMPATTGINTATQAGNFTLPETTGYPPASSSYCQTAYDCPHTGSTSTTLQGTSSYPSTHAQHQQPPQPPSSGLTRRLQHYPLEPAVPYTHQSGFSPPQPMSASSNSSKSPISTYYPSPPNSNELQHTVTTGHHADPPSLTPSPESRDCGQFTTESLVERVIPPQDFLHRAQHYNSSLVHNLPRMESYV